MEGFQYLISKSNIEGININALEKLLENKAHNQYSIKKVINGSIVAFDSNKGKICIIGCTNEYYNFFKKDQFCDCVSIQNILFGEYGDYPCDKCHLKAIKLWKQKEIEKK